MVRTQALWSLKTFSVYEFLIHFVWSLFLIEHINPHTRYQRKHTQLMNFGIILAQVRNIGQYLFGTRFGKAMLVE